MPARGSVIGGRRPPSAVALPAAPGPRVDSARRQRTRERLMDAAYELFAAQGVHATPIEAIAEAAGFTRGAFYSNFESKTELFFALAEREWRARLDHLRATFDQLLPAGAVPRDRLDPETAAGLMAEIFDSLPDDRLWHLVHAEFALLAMRDPEVAPRFLASTAAVQGELAQLLDATLRSLGLRFVLDPADVTRLLVEQHDAALRDAILSGADDRTAVARATVMRSLPVLLSRLTEPLDG
ncbi:MAG: TetR family transcriptional regulator [Actinotalea sp.]|nr:TetR family transcriptional regulator [Actinotalea sp.]